MRNEDDFLYYLTDDEGRSYYVSPTGNVEKTNTPTRLQNSPQGWKETAIKFARNNNKPGMFRSFTIPLKFFRDGAKILKSIYYNFRIQAAINLVMLKKNINTDEYDSYYYGSPDLTTFNDNQYGVSVNVMERGLPELIKANENTTYEIPIDVPEAVTINWDGVELFSRPNILIPQSIEPDIDGTGYRFTMHLQEYVIVGSVLSSSETIYPSLLFNDSTDYRDLNSLDPNIHLPEDWMFRATENVSITGFNVKIEFNIFNSNTSELFFYVYNEVTLTSRTIPLGSDTGFGPGAITVTNASFSLNANEKVWLIFHWGPPVTGVRQAIIGISLNDPDAHWDMNFSYNYRKDPTQVKALRGQYVFDQLIQKITTQKYTSSSSLLEQYSDYVMTCGDAIRGLPGAKIKTTLNEFQKSFNVFTAGEFGISTSGPQVAMFEDESFFWNNTYLEDFGEVNNASFSTYNELIFNTIEIGWPNQNYEDVNGRNEFNNTFEWGTPITRIAKKIDLTSIYRADSIGAEILRINLENKTTTDSDSDNDTFIINIESTPVAGAYNLNRPSGIIITGVLSPDTVFNILLSPGRCLRKHSAKIRAVMLSLETEYLTFQSTPKNQELKTVEGSVTIDEDANIRISSLPILPYYQPVVITVDCNVLPSLKDIIELNPYGKVPFIYSGKRYYGYILECGQEPALNAPQNFKLLAAAETDLTQRINTL